MLAPSFSALLEGMPPSVRFFQKGAFVPFAVVPFVQKEDGAEILGPNLSFGCGHPAL